MGDAEDVLALAHGRAEGDVLLLGLPCLLPPGLNRKRSTMVIATHHSA